MRALGVDVSSDLGPVLVVWARRQCGESVMMRVFGSQLLSYQLPVGAFMDSMSHVGYDPPKVIP